MGKDIQALKERLGLVSLVENHGIELQKKNAVELIGLCPFHDEKTPSFTVNQDKQAYYCFGCGEGGDELNFLQTYYGLDFKAALEKYEELAGGVDVSVESATKKQGKKRQNKARWVPLPLVPDNAGPPPDTFSFNERGNWVERKVAKRWPYLTREGKLIGYTCRFEWEVDGETKKDVLPCTWAGNEETGAQGWRWLSFGKPRPLYGLQDIPKYPADRQVLVVEGEKTADAARALFPALLVFSWPGGSKAIPFVDWSPVAGRKVIAWPDADRPGFQAMEGYYDARGNYKQGVADMCIEAGATGFKVIEPPPNVVEGWDLADATGWDGKKALAWARDNVRERRMPKKTEAEPEQSQSVEAPHVDEVPPPIDNEMPPEYLDEPPPPLEQEERLPFRYLGADFDSAGAASYFYYIYHARRVVCLSSAQHTKSSLLQLARLAWWRANFPSRNGVDWDAAADTLISTSLGLPVYNPDILRGRGAWFESSTNSAVVHCGGSIIVGGKSYDLREFESRYIYEQKEPIEVNTDNPLSPKESHELVDICERLTWDKPVNGKLLAGWLACSTVCGALNWRPHIWVTGPAGSGKSTIFELIIKRALGSMALFVQGETTEAGIRQTLNQDALPVIFDEAESETAAAAQRIDRILGLVRQSSTENDARIVKGTAGGKSISYRIRSCFAFSSIGTNIATTADKTRVTVLGLISNPPDKEHRAQYQELLDKIEGTLTVEYSQRLQARLVRLIPVIRENARIFAAAGTTALRSARLGDQVGALLAGVYALHSNNVVSLEAAEEFIAAKDWSETLEVNAVSDERYLLNRITEQVVKVQTEHKLVERSIGELVSVALESTALCKDEDITPEKAEATLTRHGMRVSNDRKSVYVSNTHAGIASILAGTRWAKDWYRILKRLDGAKRLDKPVRFGEGNLSRAVSVPVDKVLRNDEETVD